MPRRVLSREYRCVAVVVAGWCTVHVSFRTHRHLRCVAVCRFLEFLRQEVEKIKVGSPLDDGVKMGPLVNKIQYDKVCVGVCVLLPLCFNVDRPGKLQSANQWASQSVHTGLTSVTVWSWFTVAP